MQICSRSSPSFEQAAARAIRDWQGAVLDLVSDEGMGRRAKARYLALGVNGVGVALMIVVFAHTGGLVGAEIGVAGGTAVLAQRVLEAVFGDQAVRRLAETAKAELDARIEALMAGELLRYHAILDGLGVDPGQATRLRSAAHAVEAARAEGLPRAVGSRPVHDQALIAADERPAIEAARVAELAELYPAGSGDIVEAEIVETEELR